MGSRARDDEKFTDEEIFTARIVKEGIVLAAEERFKRILPRQRDTRTGFKRILQVRETHGWVSHRPCGYGDSAQLRNASSQDHIPNFQAGRSTPYRH